MRIDKAVPLLALLLSMACEKPYEVVRYATPNPFARPGCRLKVEHLDTENLLIGDEPEAEYVRGMPAPSANSYREDKIASEARFRGRLMRDRPALFSEGGMPDNTFILRVIWTLWKPGVAYPRVPAVADVRVQLLGLDQSPLDEIHIRSVYPGGWDTGFVGETWSSGGRMRAIMENVAAAVVTYLDDRWICARRQR